MQTPVPPFVLIDGVHEAVIRGVPQPLVDALMPDWEIRLQLPERPCLWFDDAQRVCRHYNDRPQACREFEINSKSCHLVRERWGMS